MSWTKRQVITQAFSEAGLAAYIHNLNAGQLQDAMRRLDSLMALWTTRGIVFSPVYPQPTTYGSGDLDDDTNAPNEALEPMYLHLALRIGPSYGKQPSPDTRAAAKESYTALLVPFAKSPDVVLTGAIKGAGHKSPNSPFIEA